MFFSRTDFEPLTTNLVFEHGNGNATKDSFFDFCVPSLLQILEKTPKTDAKGSVYHKQGPNLHADYPKVMVGGSVTLKVAMTYGHLGVHHVIDGGTKDPRPIARLVFAEVRTNDSELILVFNGHHDRKLTLASPCMVIANVEQPGSSHPQCDPSDNHFKLYSNLLDDANVAIACDGSSVTTSSTVQCDWVLRLVNDAARKMLPAAISTECGNTQWP